MITNRLIIIFIPIAIALSSAALAQMPQGKCTVNTVDSPNGDEFFTIRNANYGEN